MKTTNLELHIDRLVLEGFEGVDRDRLGEALRVELERRFVKHGIPRALTQGRAMADLHVGSVQVAPGVDGEGVGRKVGKVVYGGFG